MPGQFDNAKTATGGGRQRKRMRGMFTGKTGKAIGFTSIAAPIIGYIVNDLKKPDSLVRGLIGSVARKLLPAKSEPAKVIDITDDVEILENDSDKKS